MKRDFRKCGIVLLAGLLWQWPEAARSDDHGNDPADATPLDIGVVVPGTLDSEADIDCFQAGLEPNAWYGFVLFGFPTWNFDLQVLTGEGQPPAAGCGSTVILPAGAAARTNHPVVRYNPANPGSGGDEYRLAGLRFPDTNTPLQELADFTLAPTQAVDGRVFSIENTGTIHAVCLGALDDPARDPQLVFWPRSGDEAAGQISWGQHVQLFRFAAPGELRTLVHNPIWDNMSTNGDRIGLRIQELTMNALSGGTGTGRIASACTVAGWTTPLPPETLHAVWLQDPAGHLPAAGDYDLAVFSVKNGQWSNQDSTDQAMLFLETPPADEYDDYAFTVFARAARPQDYILRAATFTDDYGVSESDVPPPGNIQANAETAGVLEVPPDEDGFWIPMQAGLTYAFYSPDEERFAMELAGDGQWPEYLTGRLFAAPEAGTGSVRVAYGWSDGPVTGTYRFVVSGFLDEADNGPSNAIPLTVGGPAVINDLKAAGDLDWLVFNVASGQIYTVSAGWGRDLDLYGDQEEIQAAGRGPDLEFTADFNGPCYATVRAAPAAGTYSVQVVQGSVPPGDYAVWAAGYDLGDLDGPADDADADGFANEEERIAGTNPSVAGDLFQATQAVRTAAGNGLILGSALPGRVYTARSTTNLLADWTDWPTHQVAITNGQVFAAIDTNQPCAVFRLSVKLE